MEQSKRSFRLYGIWSAVRQEDEIIKDPASKKSYKAAKLKKGQYYKYVVIAYKEIYKEKRTIATSVSVHASTSGGKYKVPSGISISKSKVTVKKGKTLTLKPGLKMKGKGTFKTHIAKFR